MDISKKKLLNRHRIVTGLMMIFDAIVVNLSFVFGFILRYYVGTEINPYAIRMIKIFIKFAPIYAVICVIVFWIFKIYHTMWQYAGLKDLNRILCASIVSGLLYVIGTLVIFDWMSFSFYAIGTMIQFIAITCSRFAYKVWLMERNQVRNSRSASTNTLIVGIDEISQFARRHTEESSRLKTVCYLDVHRMTQNQLLNGIIVVDGLAKLEGVLTAKNIGHVIIADVKLSAEQKDKIKEICDNNNVEVEDFIEYLQNNNDSEVPVVLNTNADGARVIPFSPPDITDKEIDEVKNAMKSGWITTGPRTKELEKRLADFCHTGKVVCLNSATAAEELNLRICGIGEGDEVIVPAYTYTATASAVIHCGAKVVFVDSQPDSTEMDYEKVAEAITEKTKAIVAVDLGGIIADYDRLFEIVEVKKALFRPLEGDSLGARIQQAFGRVMVFADGAHSLGASRNGKMAGEIADFTSFSFHAVKNFTTAEGGASTWRDIVGIDNDEMYKQYQLYSLHGQSKDALAKTQLGAWEYDIIGPWYKCNMTDIMAAIGLRQLDRYEALLNRRKEIVAKYDAVCDELGVKHLIHSGDSYQSSNHLYITRIPNANDDIRREIIIKLAEQGVNTNVHYKPLPMMTAYKNLGWDIKDFPNAHAYYSNLVTLPLHTKLSDEDVEYVTNCFKSVVKECI